MKHNKYLRSKWIRFFLITTALITVTNIIIAYKIGDSLKNVFENVKILEPDISLNILTGNISSDNGIINLKNNEGSIYSTIEYDHFCFQDFSYWEYLINGDLVVNRFSLINPTVVYRSSENTQLISSDTTNKEDINLLIKNLNIENANSTIIDGQSDSIAQFMDGGNIELHNLKFEKAGDAENQVTFDLLNCHVDTLFTKAGNYEYLSFVDLNINQTDIAVNSLRFYTKYSKNYFNKILPYERDHYELTVAKILLEDLDINKIIHTQSVQINKASIENPYLRIMRDKLVKDENDPKPSYLYSKIIRDCDYPFNIDRVTISNGYIQYIEKSKTENDGGHLKFTNLNATIKHLGNRAKEYTDIDVDAIFMDNSTLHVDWVLDTNNSSDAFTFDANLGNFNASDINEFVGPHSNLGFYGHLLETDIHIVGDNRAVTCNLGLSYKNLEIKILEDNNKVNKIISKLANFMIKGRMNNKIKKVSCSKRYEKVPESSFWNYIWNSLRGSLLDCLT